MADSQGSPEQSNRMRDPVCGASFDVDQAVASFEYQGSTYYFQHIKCKMLFEREPDKYLTRSAGALEASAPAPSAETISTAEPNERPVRRRMLMGGLAALGLVVAAIAVVTSRNPEDRAAGPNGADSNPEPKTGLAASDSEPSAADAALQEGVPLRAATEVAEAAPPSAPSEDVPSAEPEGAVATGKASGKTSKASGSAEVVSPAKPSKRNGPNAASRRGSKDGGGERSTVETDSGAESNTPAPADAKDNYELGNRYLAENKPKAAAAAFKTAIKMDPKFAEAYVALGVAYRRLNNDKLAAESFMTYLKLSPTGVEADRVRKMVQEYEGKPK